MENNNHVIEKKAFPFGGILLVLAGFFMLLQQFTVIELTGSIFFGALALFFILWGATTRNIGLLIPGGILSGMSLGVFLIEDNTGIIPEHLEGTTFLLSLALGFALITVLGLIFTNAKAWWALIVAGIMSLVAVGVAIVESPGSSAIKPVAEAFFRSLNYLWPVALVALGLWIIFKKNEE
ncbi:MAG: hypothetical protein ISR58_00735 [Anaerolineales bacterium]|nr:hypothetical protein [Chloroflexota bacterium]MBL6979689.1 hypothetical protein [Anaerolineales bacterium]